MIAGQDIGALKKAAFDLMVESLGEKDRHRQMQALLLQGALPEQLAKLAPVRKVADGYYSFAVYLLWLRGMMESGIAMEILADEAEGLRAIEAARSEFEASHPACPQCGLRQSSSTPIMCHSCGMKFQRRKR